MTWRRPGMAAERLEERAHASVLFGKEHELDPQLRAAHLADRPFRAFVPGVEVEEQGGCEAAFRVLAKRLEDHLQVLARQTYGFAGQGHASL